jgi:hypothetical protein
MIERHEEDDDGSEVIHPMDASSPYIFLFH